MLGGGTSQKIFRTYQKFSEDIVIFANTQNFFRTYNFFQNTKILPQISVNFYENTIKFFHPYSYFSQFTLCLENYLNLPKNLLEIYVNLPKNLLEIYLKLLMSNYYGGCCTPCLRQMVFLLSGEDDLRLVWLRLCQIVSLFPLRSVNC
jgi:hypothetical protein